MTTALDSLTQEDLDLEMLFMEEVPCQIIGHEGDLPATWVAVFHCPNHHRQHACQTCKTEIERNFPEVMAALRMKHDVLVCGMCKTVLDMDDPFHWERL